MSYPLFIAEVKTESPFGFVSDLSWEALLDIAIEHGEIVAVHTDQRWGGSFGKLEAAARILSKVGYPERKHPDRDKPLLLAKGIHAGDFEIRHALDCGADLVLVVGREPPRELRPVCIYEPTTFSDIIDVPTSQMVMWNERDLTTGRKRDETATFADVRKAHQGWLCQASFIKGIRDIDPSASAFIVGQHLPEFAREMDDA